MYYIAASQGPLFAQSARDFTEHIRRLGAECVETATVPQITNGELS